MSADDFWKRKSYSTAATSLEDHPEAIESAKQALKLKGVGKGCAALVRCSRVRNRVSFGTGAQTGFKRGIAGSKHTSVSSCLTIVTILMGAERCVPCTEPVHTEQAVIFFGENAV